MKTISPPTQEGVQALIKCVNSSSERYTREAAIEALRMILKTKCNNLDSIIGDVSKLLTKTVNDKYEQIRVISAVTLIDFYEVLDE